jgi:hypothetical protein
MLLALLPPDPYDPNCPGGFNDKAGSLLKNVQGEPGPKDIDPRKALLRSIGGFSTASVVELRSRAPFALDWPRRGL